MENIDDKIAQQTKQLFEKFADSNRNSWITAINEDANFRLGNQWTEEQVAEMTAKGQPPISINRIHPAVEMAKAMLTSQRPSFRVSPREDSDNQIAQAMNGLLQYVWQISDADMKHSDIVDDMLTKTVGYWYVYIDPHADNGKGEVKLDRLRVEEVFVDPNSRDRFFRDASDIIISRKYTKGLLKQIYPEFRKAISNACGNDRDDYVGTANYNLNKIYNPDEEEINRDDDFAEYIRYYERYTKEIVKRWAVYEDFSGIENILDDNEFKEYIKRPAWNVNGKIYSNQLQVQEVYNSLIMAYNQELDNLKQAEALVAQGQLSEEEYAKLVSTLPLPPKVDELTFNDLLQAGIIKSIQINTKRVKMICVVGDTTLYQRHLKTEDYPIIPYCNIHTGTPYPVSDVRIIRDKQCALNKINSIIISHASLSTNSKLIVPQGSCDVKDLERRWTIPGSIHEMALGEGEGIPIVVHPLPIPNELFALDNVYKNDIDHEFGIYESMMGNAQQSPSTYRATIAIDEFGQRKLRNKMQIIETGLTLLGKIVLSFCQELYSNEKIIRLLQPNNSMTEYAINKKIYDQYNHEVINVVNDISRAKYDVIVVAGSTLPSNRYAQLEMYMDAYKNGIIDNVEVLKKTEIFDIEGVLERTDRVTQLTNALQQAEEKIKQLSGDLQTAQRETMHANFRTINAEYKAKEHANYVEGQKQNELFTARATDKLNNVTESANIQLEKEKMKMQNTANKKESK